MVLTKYKNRSSVIIQESNNFQQDVLNRQDIYLLENFKCVGYLNRNKLNLEVDMFVNQIGKSGIVFRFLKADLYYLQFTIHFITPQLSFFKLSKYYYNNEIILD